MERRQFIRTGSAVVAGVVAAQVTPSAVTADAIDTSLYDLLYSTIVAYYARHNCRLDVDELPDEVHALLAAKRWSHKTGVTFTWRQMPDHRQCAIWNHDDGLTTYLYEGEWHDARFCFDYDTGDRLWRCDAYRNGKRLGHDQGWQNPAAAPLLAMYCECRLAWHLLSETGGVIFDSIRSA